MSEVNDTHIIAAIKAHGEHTAGAVTHLQRLVVDLQTKVDQLIIADARRIGFWRGARFGARLSVLGLAAALGGGVSKAIEWFAKALTGP